MAATLLVGRLGPWRALATLAERWPMLCFEARPSYDEAS